MNLPLRRVSLLACACSLCACAPDQGNDSPSPETPASKETKYKKPVRMNGRGEVSSISFEEFFARQEAGKVLLYDARHPIFYRIGHIPGAINIPLNDCDTTIHEREEEIKTALAEGKTIVTYCSGITCPDARSLARHISGFGYPASVFSGGWDAWNDAGLPHASHN